MKRNTLSLWRGCRFGLVAAVATWAVVAAGPAMASLQVSISPPALGVASGSTGALEVMLTNTGTSSVSIGAFAFQLSASNAYLAFTTATTATIAPYIFDGSSALGPTISVSPPSLPGQVIEASDATTLLSGITVAPGAAVGLGRVLFDVSSSAPSTSVPVTFVASATNLSDADPLRPRDIPIDSLLSGTVNIQGVGVVPEPSMFAIFSIGIGLVTVFRVSRKIGRG